MTFKDEFTLLTSNGLNVYEPDDDKIRELYQQFFKVLIPGGILVTSFFTSSPNIDPNSEWDMSQINSKGLLLSKIIMFDILDIKFVAFRSSLITKLQLKTAGFNEINFFYNAKVYPTVVAGKPK